ncbi:magnesium-translocating P-type ATPase [Candidatus Peregrinibacteria bacterium]|nr:magnesium-translocating P-type ATPase [Candidatus Peregrinibacteria bacterium]
MIDVLINKVSRLSIDAVLKEFSCLSSGLSSDEVKKRLNKFGHNVLVEKKESHIIVQFLSHFTSPLILVLIFAGVFSFFIGEVTDAIIIGLMVLFGGALDFFQEYGASKALKKLIDTVKTTATVMRDRKKQEIAVSLLVPGDIVLLSSGDMIPADCRIIESDDFFVNQSSITGESFSSGKNSIPFKKRNVSMIDMDNIVFRGTNVVTGSATAIVIKTGKETEFGKISEKLAESPVKSEFENGINSFGLFIMKIILVLVVFIFFFNSLFKHDYFQSFMFAIAIAVGITPELLPMIMSVTMAVGSKKMSKNGVIVKNLSSIPNFGSMNILCTDKTGTLTENKIVLVKYSNYKGDDDERVLDMAYVSSVFQAGIKNPLDDAVLAYRKINVKNYKKVDEIPYDFFRKRMSIVTREGKKIFLVTKGAPEEVFKCCKYYNKNGKKTLFDKSVKEKALKTYLDLSRQGFRVLAVAQKDVANLKKQYSKDEESNLVFGGFVSFLDPPKKDVKEVLMELAELGVSIKIITGDNELVTKKICDEVGLSIDGVVLGSDLDKLTDEALRLRAAKITVFARCSPDQKTRIINALRAGGNVVGYMGDGINDAPSLKAADVGISVSSAVDIAKESASIVLTKHSLGDLKDGIVEGRKTFGNNMKYIMTTLSSNFGNMFSAAGAVFFLPFLPMLPIQILLNNLIYDVSQITIPSDNVDREWILSPKRWDISFVKKFMYVFGPISSLFDFATFFIIYYLMNASAGVFQTAWFMESLATQTFVVHIIRTRELPVIKSRASLLLTLSGLLCVAIGWIIPYTFLGEIFKFEPLTLNVVLALVGITFAYLVVVEITKRIFYRRVSF